MIGKSLEHYDILVKLGQGGMGEVYRARDNRLDRDVALKVLPADMAEDAERLSRFEREAKVIAALNHPNIVTLHSVEHADGIHFLTMELVDGQGLDHVIPESGLPFDQFLEIAIPLADAISSAHAKGITHRDLKPDNVMLDGSKRVKVLDFGLAKLLEIDERGGATMTMATDRTAEGRILGTAAYMSPEQAEGKPVDPRSDVFSLGILLYEMATGRRPFHGDTAISTISSIVKETPPTATSLNRSLPRHLGRIITRCLEKDPERRYQSALEVRNELEVLKRELDSGELFSTSEALPAAPGNSKGLWPWAAIVAGVAAIVALFGWSPWKSTQATAPAASGASNVTQITSHGGIETHPSFSADGNFLVYAAESGGDLDIFLQRAGGMKPINLTEDSDSHEFTPAVSPNGEAIAFRSLRQGGGIFVMGSTGESVRRIVDHGANPAWSPDSRQIVYSTEHYEEVWSRQGIGELWVVESDGSNPRKIHDGDAVQPAWSPNGHRVAYWKVERNTGGWRDVWTVGSDGTDPKAITADEHVDWCPVWSPDGNYLYFLSDRGGVMNLWRVAIDEASGDMRGDFESVPMPTPAMGEFAISHDGARLAYTSLTRQSRLFAADVDPVTHELTGVPRQLTGGTMLANSATVSPDGQWVVFRRLAQFEDLFLVRSDGTGLRQLTDDPYRDRGPSWAPDGRILFYSDRSGRYELWSVRDDGGDLRQHTESTGFETMWFPKYSPDGKTVIGMNESGTLVYDVPPDGDLFINKRYLPEADDGMRFFAWDWSPDGEYLAGWFGDNPLSPTPRLGLYFVAEERFEMFPADPDQKLIPYPSPKIFGDGALVAMTEEGLVLVSMATGKIEQVLLQTGRVPTTMLSFPRDQNRIFYTLAPSESDLWLADLH